MMAGALALATATGSFPPIEVSPRGNEHASAGRRAALSKSTRFREVERGGGTGKLTGRL